MAAALSMGSTGPECVFWQPGLAARVSVFLPASHVNAACPEQLFKRPRVCLSRGEDLELVRVPCCQQVNAACPERGPTGPCACLSGGQDQLLERARARRCTSGELAGSAADGMALWSGEAGASALTGVYADGVVAGGGSLDYLV